MGCSRISLGNLVGVFWGLKEVDFNTWDLGMSR